MTDENKHIRKVAKQVLKQHKGILLTDELYQAMLKVDQGLRRYVDNSFIYEALDVAHKFRHISLRVSPTRSYNYWIYEPDWVKHGRWVPALKTYAKERPKE